MAFPTWQAAGAVVESAVGDISPAWPAHQADDIGILIVQTTHGFTRLTVPAGFQEMPVSPQSGSTGSQTGVGLRVFWKRATGAAEPTPTILFHQHVLRAQIVTFRGCSTTGRPFTTAAGKETGSSSSTSVVFPSLTTTEPDSLIVDIVRHNIDAAGPKLSGWTNASTQNKIERIDDATATNLGGGFAVHTAEKPAAGVVDSTTATLSVTAVQAMISFALTAVAQPVDKTPYLKAYGVASSSAAAAISPAWPTHVAGDIALLFVESGGWPVALSVPAGFTEIANSPQNAGVSGQTSASHLSVYWCRATSAAMGAPTVPFVADHIKAVIVTFGNVLSAGDPVDVSNGNNTSGLSATTDFSVPGGNTTVPNTLAVIAGSSSRSTTTWFEWNNWANASLRYLTKRYDDVSPIGNGGGIGFATGEKVGAGTIDTTTAILSGTTHQGRIMLALKGAAGGDLASDKGIFNLTGKEANLLHDRVLTSDPGVFAFQGMDVDFPIVQTYTIEAERGDFASEGFGVFLTKSSRGWRKQQEKKTPVWTKKPKLDLES